MQTIIYPGTFDPIHNGHIDLIQRASNFGDAEVVVAVSDSKNKQPLFSLNKRIELCEQSLSHLKNIRVCAFNGLIIDFVKSQNSHIVLRGLRTASDFDYELQMTNMNRDMSPQFETIFLTPNKSLSSISSSLIREISGMGGDVEQFVPANVLAALHSKHG